MEIVLYIFFYRFSLLEVNTLELYQVLNVSTVTKKNEYNYQRKFFFYTCFFSVSKLFYTCLFIYIYIFCVEYKIIKICYINKIMYVSIYTHTYMHCTFISSLISLKTDNLNKKNICQNKNFSQIKKLY